MNKSLYAVLNVAPDADPAVIEAAYKALMKKYHPDLAGGGPAEDQGKATEINEAYRILKDPERRASYDEEERARQEAARRPPPVARPIIYPPHPPQPRPKRRWPTLLLIAVLAAIVYLVWERSDQQFAWRAADTAGALAATPKSEPPSAAVLTGDALPEEVRRAVTRFRKIGKERGLLGLTAYSQDCFAAHNRSPTAEAFDHCVAFDYLAAGYDAAMMGGYVPQIPRFQERELAARHSAAGRLLSAEDEWTSRRTAQIRALMMETLKAELPRPNSAAAAAVSVAPAAAAPARSWQPTRQARPRHPPRKGGRKKADKDFLEREGYIY